VHRVTGTAQGRMWSMVLKVVQDPATIGLDFIGSYPGHYNYWQREPLLHAAGFFQGLPDAFSYPRGLGVVRPTTQQTWLWLEDVPDDGSPWDHGRLADAAYRAGRFHGSYLVDAVLPDLPCLTTPFLRSWVSTTTSGLLPYLTDPADTDVYWARPEVAALRVASADHRLRELLARLEPHFRLLDRMPRTLNHRDLWPTNLLYAGDGRPTLIDWGLASIGPVGEELVQLQWHPAEHGLRTPLAMPYLEGLRDSGWAGEKQTVSYSLAVSFAARVGTLLLVLLHYMPVKSKGPSRDLAQADGLISCTTADRVEPLAPRPQRDRRGRSPRHGPHGASDRQRTCLKTPRGGRNSSSATLTGCSSRRRWASRRR